MKFRKFLAAVTASVVAVSSLTVTGLTSFAETATASTTVSVEAATGNAETEWTSFADFCGEFDLDPATVTSIDTITVQSNSSVFGGGNVDGEWVNATVTSAPAEENGWADPGICEFNGPLVSTGFYFKVGVYSGGEARDLAITITYTVTGGGTSSGDEEPGEEEEPGDTPAIPEGTKCELGSTEWNWQANLSADVPGITNWTTTAPEAVEILEDKEITVTVPINGALSDGKAFDLSKLNVDGVIQTKDGLWKTVKGVKGDNGVYTITFKNYADDLSAKTDVVNFGIQLYVATEDATAPIDVYLGTVEATVATDAPVTPDLPDPSEVDTSAWQIAVYCFGEGWTCDWENGAVASDNGVLTLTTTVGDAADKCGVSGIIGGLNLQVWNALPIGGKVAYAILIKDKNGNTILNESSVTTVSEGDYGADCSLGQFCTEICYGDFVFSKTDVITIAVVPGTTPPTISDNSGSENEPGDTTNNKPAPVGSTSLPSSKPSTPSDEDKNTVKFENNDTKIEVDAPEGAFENATDVTFNAAPVADETKDGKFTFDLSFTGKDGNKVQPKAAVTVKVPVPEALKGKTVYVYHIEDNGTYTEISCKVENGMVVFSASSFSKYVVSDTKLSANGTPDTSGDSNKPGSNPNTGVAALSLLPIAAAVAGVVIFKKRK